MASKDSSRSTDSEGTGSAEIDRLRTDLDRVRSDIGDLARAVKSAGYAKAGEARRTVEDELHQVADRIRSGTKDARDTLQSEVQERPLVTMLVAFGVGVLVGKILDR